MVQSGPEPAFEAAKRLFFEGLAALQAGRLEDAERAFLGSLEAVPGRPSTLLNLATTRLRMRRPVEAIAAADAVLAAQPGDVDALAVRAMSLGQLGLHEQALAAYDRVLEADPRQPEMWSQRGSLLREMGRLDEAAQAYEQAHTRGDDPALTGYFLAAVARGEAPGVAPARYVEGLFDDYAIEFDEHLVTVLGYRAHAVLADNLPDRDARRYESALDLGCGTGLCGPLVKPHAARLTGVDLASRMLQQARGLGVYDALVQAELIAWLASNRESFDLIVSADVFIYIGDLEPVFAGARRALAPTGVFCFSIELGAEDDAERGFTLQPSLRYTHSERYIGELASRHGFAIVRSLRAPIREDQKQTVDGAYFYLAVP
jgi:predicted TPR repeat methyltransferase